MGALVGNKEIDVVDARCNHEDSQVRVNTLYFVVMNEFPWVLEYNTHTLLMRNNGFCVAACGMQYPSKNFFCIIPKNITLLYVGIYSS